MKFTKIVFKNKNKLSAIKSRLLSDDWFVGKLRSSKLKSKLKLSFLKACEKNEFITYNENRGKALIGHLINASSCPRAARIVNSEVPISFNQKMKALPTPGERQIDSHLAICVQYPQHIRS